MNNNYEQIEALMLLKDFDELSFKEQAFIQSSMSSEVYQQQRNILIESKLILSKKVPLKGTPLNNLQAHFVATHKNYSWQSTRIPIYQALLLAAFFGFIVWWCHPIKTETHIKKEIIYLPKIDTITQEKLIIKEKVIYKTKLIEVPIKLIDTIYIPTIDKEQFYQEKEGPTIFAKQNPKGKTIKDVEGLMHFVVGSE